MITLAEIINTKSADIDMSLLSRVKNGFFSYAVDHIRDFNAVPVEFEYDELDEVLGVDVCWRLAKELGFFDSEGNLRKHPLLPFIVSDSDGDVCVIADVNLESAKVQTEKEVCDVFDGSLSVREPTLLEMKYVVISGKTLMQHCELVSERCRVVDFA